MVCCGKKINKKLGKPFTDIKFWQTLILVTSQPSIIIKPDIKIIYQCKLLKPAYPAITKPINFNIIDILIFPFG